MRTKQIQKSAPERINKMGKTQPRMINIFTTVYLSTYQELSTIAFFSTQQRRAVYRMALMYAACQAGFWNLFLLSGNFDVKKQAEISKRLMDMSEKIQSWHEKENAPSA